MKDIESNKLYTYSVNESSSIPMVFLHGFTGNCLTWRGIQERLKNYTISIKINWNAVFIVWMRMI